MSKPNTPKQIAQEQLLIAMQIAFLEIKAMNLPKAQKDKIYGMADRQFARVERLFGYEAGYFSRLR